jgi:hypothetical protein
MELSHDGPRLEKHLQNLHYDRRNYLSAAPIRQIDQNRTTDSTDDQLRLLVIRAMRVTQGLLKGVGACSSTHGRAVSSVDSKSLCSARLVGARFFLSCVLCVSWIPAF